MINILYFYYIIYYLFYVYYLFKVRKELKWYPNVIYFMILTFLFFVLISLYEFKIIKP